MEAISLFLKNLGVYSWNLPLIMLLVGTGAFFTSMLWFIQARRVRHAFHIIRGDYDDPEDEGDITHFQALCAALSATIGVGNIAGVATALHFGGPGAIFWMWITAFVGMATKYATCLLSQKYRHVHTDGTVSGGPMYYIEKGLGQRFKWLAILFASCAVVASFGGGNMVQSNSMTEAFVNYFGTPRLNYNTPLATLNDGKGVGETLGNDFIVHTQGGQRFKVDIVDTYTLKDLMTRINEHPKNMGRRMRCEYKNNRLFFFDLTKGSRTFELLPKSPAFDGLKIINLKGSTTNHVIHSTPIPNNIRELNNGRGLIDFKGPELIFSLRDGSLFQVDLAKIQSISEIAYRINNHERNRLVQFKIHLDQKHLRFQDYTKGDQTFFLEPHSYTVEDLGFTKPLQSRWTYSRESKDKKDLKLESPLSLLNQDYPIRRGRGFDFVVHLHDGSQIYFDLKKIKTVGGFLKMINSNPENTDMPKISGRISPKRNKIMLVDLTAGNKAFEIRSFSSTLSDLWFTSPTSGSKPNIIETISPKREGWRIALGLLISISVWLVIVGGIKRIGQVASKLVPFMCILYVFGALSILILHYQAIPGAFGSIFYYAFSSTDAVEGGFAGAAVMMTITWGIKRAVFSNEAGLGSAPIAHAAAKTTEPVREGLVAMLGPLIDTIVVCTMTALVILVTNQWALGENGAALTQDAFSVGLPGGLGGGIVALGLVLFAFSTSISWSYYGDRCTEYLFGKKAITPYRWIFCIFLFIGSILKIDAVWDFADVTMAAMAFPNLIATLALSGVVLSMTKDYFGREHTPIQKEKQEKIEEQKESKEKTQKTMKKETKKDPEKKPKRKEKKERTQKKKKKENSKSKKEAPKDKKQKRGKKDK